MTVTELIDFFGGTNATARALGISPPSVTEWKRRSIPLERCIQIEEVTSGKVRCEHLRPDINWSVLRGTQAAQSKQVHHEVSPSGS